MDQMKRNKTSIFIDILQAIESAVQSSRLANKWHDEIECDHA